MSEQAVIRSQWTECQGQKGTNTKHRRQAQRYRGDDDGFVCSCLRVETQKRGLTMPSSEGFCEGELLLLQWRGDSGRDSGGL